MTEMKQILPLYGLTFIRNEYFILWKDPNFEGKNKFSSLLQEMKLFIYREVKLNAYFETSTEKALEMIKRKQFNKIILISNIGPDYNGRKFVQISRKILRFDVVVLFFSENREHLKWLQSFPNALYTDNIDFCKEYILNFNLTGLQNLNMKIQSYYKINLKPLTNDCISFPNFINTTKYESIKFENKNPYFKKAYIYNQNNRSILCMDEKRNVFFKPVASLNVSDYKWYLTMIDKKITLFSNGSYLSANIQKGIATGTEFMDRYYFEIIQDGYVIHYGNINYILTIDGSNAKITPGYQITYNQVFKIIEPIEF